ncbi:MAG: divergent polysaccharide deacetylase family protein, partial [Thalassotalea sp.]|nr:divergent polysaccharide deacetylase family protein [Thalassotalea sp.]
FLKLIRMSKRDGIVVAIAHPHPETIRVLERMIPLLADKDIELISISEMLPKDHPIRIAQQAKLLSDRSEGE